MFKKFVLALAVALAVPAMAAAQKLGTVDTQSVFQDMPETAAAQTQLNEASKKYEDEFKKLQEEVDKKYQEFQALAADTPDAIKERRMQEVQEFAQKADRFRQTAAEDLQRQQSQLMSPIQQKLTDAIKSVGQEGGYTMIFPVEIPLYVGATATDVTAAVRAKLGLPAAKPAAAAK